MHCFCFQASTSRLNYIYNTHFQFYQSTGYRSSDQTVSLRCHKSLGGAEGLMRWRRICKRHPIYFRSFPTKASKHMKSESATGRCYQVGSCISTKLDQLFCLLGSQILPFARRVALRASIWCGEFSFPKDVPFSFWHVRHAEFHPPQDLPARPARPI